jgi:N6-L-threonylcarbamoyladenine synthase
LIGSLLVGVETAKTLSLVWNKPIVPVNHLWGHIYSNWLKPEVNSKLKIENRKIKQSIHHLPFSIHFPIVALVVSGGHTDLVLMNDHGKSKWLGGTFDDAAGEAFDKIARFLNLGYPGGPAIEKVSKNGNPKAFDFPRPLVSVKNFDFSFSGLKTAVVNTVKKEKSLTQSSISNLAASFQQAVVDVLVEKTIQAAEKFEAKEIIVGGGVAANSDLRSQLTANSKKLGIPVRFADKEYCGDNAAMIASAAYFNFKPKSISQIQASPSLHF